MENHRFNLKIELVPSTVWYASFYQFYKKNNQLNKWRDIKNNLFEKEGHQCWICGKKGIRLDAHEFWEYDDKNHIQRLVAIHHLCDLCHKIKHIGLWCHTLDGQRQMMELGLTRNDLIKHFCKVNNCPAEEFERHEKEAFRIWEERSRHKWKQDFGIEQARLGQKERIGAIKRLQGFF